MPNEDELTARVMDDLAYALSLSNEMLVAVKAGEWDSVSTLATERLAHLEQFFSLQIEPERAAEVESVIRNIQSLDRQIEVYCTAEREQLAKQLQGLKQHKAGMAAYQSNG